MAEEMPALGLQKKAPEKSKHWEHLRIPLHVIKNCTQDFNERNFIAKGGYGRVYKGILSWENHKDQPVAVKRLDDKGFQGKKEFHNEVTMLSKYQHENIVALIGFCDDSKEMILVYEYASRGSLDTYLRDSAMSGELSWLQRIKICVGVASALDYLHNRVAESHRIIHRDIKSANVLLDDNWNPKLSDFGLSTIGLANVPNTLVITNPAGTPGYCDPQYQRTGILTKESDIYSFGVVLFEVLCGRLACVVNYHDERRFLHHLARTCYKNGEVDKIVDLRIRNDIEPETLSKFSAIAYQCLQITREERPTIAEVASQLKEAWKLQMQKIGGQEITKSDIPEDTPGSSSTTMKSNNSDDYVEITLDIADDKVAVHSVKTAGGANVEDPELAKGLGKRLSLGSLVVRNASARIRQVSEELRRLTAFSEQSPVGRLGRAKSPTAHTLKGLKFISKNEGGTAWAMVERQFDDMTSTTNGLLPRSLFGRCIGMNNDSKEFAGELFDALCRRRNITGDVINKAELYEFWSQISDQSFDSRLQTFYDMVDKDADGRITQEDVKELIRLSALANKLPNIERQAEEYAALIMEELDPDNAGYIMIENLEMLLLQARQKTET